MLQKGVITLYSRIQKSTRTYVLSCCQIERLGMRCFNFIFLKHFPPFTITLYIRHSLCSSSKLERKLLFIEIVI